MKSILLLVLIAFFPLLQQQKEPGKDPDVSVVRFTWAKEGQPSSAIRGRGPIGTPQTEDRDYSTRRVEMRTLPTRAARTGGLPDTGQTYHLRLEFKNTGTNIVRSLIWEFKPTEAPEGYEPKQYLCSLKVKPKEKKILDLWTPFSPVKVVNVNARTDALKDGEVIVNRIEYEDGSIWKRADWLYAIPSHSAQKLADGECSVF